MIDGAFADSVEVLRAVKDTGLPCYALTNMEAETYPLRLGRFSFLSWFDGTVVSGQEGVMKPDPTIFRLLLERFRLTPEATLMIDDTQVNVDSARELGFQTILFDSPRQLRTELEELAVLPTSALGMPQTRRDNPAIHWASDPDLTPECRQWRPNRHRGG